MKWRTEPISRSCEVVLSDSQQVRCLKPTAYAYPAYPRGWMALCEEHGERHLPHATSLSELLAKGETVK